MWSYSGCAHVTHKCESSVPFKVNFNLPTQFPEIEYAKIYPWLLSTINSIDLIDLKSGYRTHTASSIVWNKSGVWDKMLCAVLVKCDLEILAWSYCHSIDSRTFVVRCFFFLFFGDFRIQSVLSPIITLWFALFYIVKSINHEYFFLDSVWRSFVSDTSINTHTEIKSEFTDAFPIC